MAEFLGVAVAVLEGEACLLIDLSSVLLDSLSLDLVIRLVVSG